MTNLILFKLYSSIVMRIGDGNREAKGAMAPLKFKDSL